MTTKHAIMLSLSVVAIVLVAIVAVFVGANNKTDAKCAKATEAFTAAQTHAKDEVARADGVLQFMNNADLHGFMDSETGSALTRTVHARKAELDLKDEAACDSTHQANLLNRKAKELDEGAAGLNEAVTDLSDALNAHVQEQVSAKNTKLDKSIVDAKREINSAVKKANETAGYRSQGDAEQLVQAAQNALKSMDGDFGIPQKIESTEDIVKANDALTNRTATQESAMIAADNLYRSVVEYEAAVKKAREEAERASEAASIKEAEEAEKAKKEKKAQKTKAPQKSQGAPKPASCRDNCNDVIVIGTNCQSYSEIRYRHSNGWSVDRAVAAARTAKCAEVVMSPNPCSACK